ncbi:hypothetical protein [Kitasatospora sp. LaBMicrA B282]|uniref:hypothetical protein n=1 Tax=Kitasatospora sp. LaBMicrA B282 TaxID=3420949 RepID=UPI003D0FA3CC
MTPGQPRCPQCSGTRTHPVRQVHDRSVEVPAGLRVDLLVPPPAPVEAISPEPQQATPRWRIRSMVFLALGLLPVLSMLVGLVTHGNLGSGFDAADQNYREGAYFGAFGVPLIFLLLAWTTRYGGAGRYRPAVRQEDHLAQRRLYTRRSQVWEHADVCLDCPGAFFAEGVLRADIPASPLIALDRFPLMVVTMADRAYGTAS